MDMNKIRPASDAAWYCRKDAEEERFYEIFFQPVSYTHLTLPTTPYV